MFLKANDDIAINLSFIKEIRVEVDVFSVEDLWCVVGYSEFHSGGVRLGRSSSKEQAVEQLDIILEAISN